MTKVQGNSKRAEQLIRRIEVAIHNDMNTAEAIADSEAAQEAKRRRLDQVRRCLGIAINQKCIEADIAVLSAQEAVKVAEAESEKWQAFAKAQGQKAQLPQTESLHSDAAWIDALVADQPIPATSIAPFSIVLYEGRGPKQPGKKDPETQRLVKAAALRNPRAFTDDILLQMHMPRGINAVKRDGNDANMRDMPLSLATDARGNVRGFTVDDLAAIQASPDMLQAIVGVGPASAAAFVTFLEAARQPHPHLSTY